MATRKFSEDVKTMPLEWLLMEHDRALTLSTEAYCGVTREKKRCEAVILDEEIKRRREDAN